MAFRKKLQEIRRKTRSWVSQTPTQNDILPGGLSPPGQTEPTEVPGDPLPSYLALASARLHSEGPTPATDQPSASQTPAPPNAGTPDDQVIAEDTQPQTNHDVPETLVSSGQPQPTISTSGSLSPVSVVVGTTPPGERIQTMGQSLASQAPIRHIPEGANSSFFAASQHLVFNHAVMGESQQIQIHAAPHPSHERQHLSQEGSQASLPRSLSNRDRSTVSENTNLAPTFIAQNQNVEIRPGLNVLKELHPHVIPGAEFNSAERDPPPRCHPGTRISIREQFRACIEDPNLKTRIIWMHGPAGVGMSAIMQTVVEEMSPHVLCGTLFFSRPNQREDARKAFPTLAYGLATSPAVANLTVVGLAAADLAITNLAIANAQYCRYLRVRMEDDPTCLTKSLDDQFKTLFVTPFVQNHVEAGSRRWVIFLDGLDECQNTKDADNQCRIINLIRDSVFNHAGSTPFIWIIASRPEDNLKKAWSEVQERFQERISELWELAIPADSDQATKDVELYLHNQFETIRTKHSELIPQLPRWPSDGDFVKIARKSSGLFIFASTVVNYLSDEDPVYRLEVIISLIDQVDEHPTLIDENPFQTLDTLYSTIMSDVPKRLLPVAKSILGFYHLLDAVLRKDPYTYPLSASFVVICNILGLRQNEAYSTLRKLRSVLVCPSPTMAQTDGIQFFHASFSDFLLDPSRSHVYHVNLDEELTNIWRCCTRIIRNPATKQGNSEISVPWPPGDGIPLSHFQERLLSDAKYSWIQILIRNFLSQPTTRKLQLDDQDLIEVFRSTGLTFLTTSHYFPVREFLDWLYNRSPRAIQEKIAQRLTLDQLDEARLLRSLRATTQYQIVRRSTPEKVDLTRTMEGKLPLTVIEEVLGESSGSMKNALATVVEVEPSDSFVIIGPLEGGQSYILPYFAA